MFALIQTLVLYLSRLLTGRTSSCPALRERLKAASTSRPVSELVNNAMKEALTEDADDIAVFKVRDREPLVSYEGILKRLRREDLK